MSYSDNIKKLFDSFSLLLHKLKKHKNALQAASEIEIYDELYRYYIGKMMWVSEDTKEYNNSLEEELARSISVLLNIIEFFDNYNSNTINEKRAFLNNIRKTKNNLYNSLRSKGINVI